MDSAERKTALMNTISSVNCFLRTFSMKEVDCIIPDRSTDIDMTAAIQKLSRELLEIAETKNNARSNEEPDSTVTQITASNKELNERIHAFMSHAQNVIDEQNVKEFCDSTVTRELPGCARTDARYKRRMTDSTHMQVTKASNVDGPQLKVTAQGLWRNSATDTRKPHLEADSTISQPIAERLNNLETHLKVKTAKSSNIYARLKNLENRILTIEGTSPEYFSNKNGLGAVTSPKDSTQTDPKNFTLQEIDDRIRMLKGKLSSKKRKIEDGASLL